MVEMTLVPMKFVEISLMVLVLTTGMATDAAAKRAHKRRVKKSVAAELESNKAPPEKNVSKEKVVKDEAIDEQVAVDENKAIDENAGVEKDKVVDEDVEINLDDLEEDEAEGGAAELEESYLPVSTDNIEPEKHPLFVLMILGVLVPVAAMLFPPRKKRRAPPRTDNETPTRKER